MFLSIIKDYVSGTVGTWKKREGNSAPGSFQFKTGCKRRMQTGIRWSPRYQWDNSHQDQRAWGLL